MTNKVLLTTILILATIVSCQRNELPKGTPECISSKVKEIKNEPVRNPKAEVWQYDYKGQTVYFIPAYCCDIYSDLYDDKCNLICHPDGGITGSGDGKCPDFISSRTNGKLIWKDGR